MSNFLPGSTGMLAPLSRFLEDKHVSEILINRPGEVWVEIGGQMFRHEMNVLTEVHLYRLFQLIASENNQKISRNMPLLSGNLQDGSRVQLCLPPVTPYPVMSIRRKVMHQMTLKDCSKSNMFSETKLFGHARHSAASKSALRQLASSGAWQLFMQEAIQRRQNIVISGGTSSGKTTFLNACLQAIDSHERLLILEDTKEVAAPHLNQVTMLASKGEQGESNVSMQDLVQCSLRLRPDRIIMGEIRGKEMMDFISACSTGHEGSITTIHANNPKLAFMRMTQMYKLNAVPSMSDDDILRELHSVIDIVIQLCKTKNGRRITEVYLD